MTKTHDFDLTDWSHSFNQPSPDWSDPVWAHRLAHDVPKLIRHAIRGRTPTHIAVCPDAMEDTISEVTLTILRRSRSPKSRWDPARGRNWQGWVHMVARSSIWKIARHDRANPHHTILPASALHGHDEGIDSYTGYGGGSVLRGTISRPSRR